MKADDETTPAKATSANETRIGRVVATSARIAKPVSIIIKLGLIVAIAWVLLSTLSAFYQWRRGPESAPMETADSFNNDPHRLPYSLLLSAFNDGTWEFAGAPWVLRMAAVTPETIDSEMVTLPSDAEQLEAADPKVRDKLVAMFQMLGANKQPVGGYQLWQLNTKTGRAALFLRHSPAGADELILGRVVLHIDGQWRLLEGRCAKQATFASQAGDILPPMPTGCEVLATRRSREGILLGQIVRLGTDSNRVSATWKNAGWNIKDSNASSAQSEKSEYLLVERGGVCFASQIFASPIGGRTLLLTRVPN